MANIVSCKLEAKETDSMGYTKYVFLCNDGTYIMCTRYPRWDHASIELGEEGFLEFQEIEAGKYYFCAKLNADRKYFYNDTQFIKFVKKPEPLPLAIHKAKMTKKVQDNE